MEQQATLEQRIVALEQDGEESKKQLARIELKLNGLLVSAAIVIIETAIEFMR